MKKVLSHSFWSPLGRDGRGSGTKHKLIWLIVAFLVIDLILFASIVRPVSAAKKVEDYNVAADISTSCNVAALQAKLSLEDESQDIIEEGKKERAQKAGTDSFLDELESMESKIFAHGITYSWSHPASSYESAINGKPRVNCATYVSWTLQQLGLLPKGYAFYISGSLHGKAASTIKNSEYFTVKYNVGKVSSADLQVGDIVGWKTHTCVYAGTDSNGNRLWYTAGGKDVSSKNLGAKTKKYSSKYITVLIRINWDKVAGE